MSYHCYLTVGFCILDNLLWGSTVGYPSGSLASCLKVSFQSLADVVNDSADATSAGRSFQICGPTTGKARLATVDSLTDGTAIRLVSVERRDLTGQNKRYDLISVLDSDLRSMLPFRGLFVCLSRSCIVLKRHKISTRFLLLTTATRLFQIPLKFVLHRSTTSSPNFAP